MLRFLFQMITWAAVWVHPMGRTGSAVSLSREQRAGLFEEGRRAAEGGTDIAPILSPQPSEKGMITRKSHGHGLLQTTTDTDKVSFCLVNQTLLKCSAQCDRCLPSCQTSGARGHSG